MVSRAFQGVSEVIQGSLSNFLRIFQECFNGFQEQPWNSLNLFVTPLNLLETPPP